MIVRIQGSGQYVLDQAAQDDLDAIDRELITAINGGDADTMHGALNRAIALVHERGDVLDEGDLRPSDLILPAADASLDETRSLLQDEGLIVAG